MKKQKSIKLDEDIWKQVKQLAEDRGATLFGTLRLLVAKALKEGL